MNAEEQRVHDKAMDLVCSQGAEIERLRAVEAYAVPRHEVCNELIRWLDTKGSASTVTTWGDQPGETIRRLIENFRDGCPATCRTDDYPGCGTCMAPDDNRCPQPPPVVPRVENKQTPPLIDPQDVFQWRGDLAAFTAWFGEPMPIDVGEQISVPVYRSASGKWNGRWLRVWSGSWIVRREDGNGEGKRHYTFPDDEFRLFIQPNVGVAAPEGAR